MIPSVLICALTENGSETTLENDAMKIDLKYASVKSNSPYLLCCVYITNN